MNWNRRCHVDGGAVIISLKKRDSALHGGGLYVVSRHGFCFWDCFWDCF